MAILLLFNVSGTWIIMSFMRCSRGCDFYQWELTRFIHVHLFGGGIRRNMPFSVASFVFIGWKNTLINAESIELSFHLKFS